MDVQLAQSGFFAGSSSTDVAVTGRPRSGDSSWRWQAACAASIFPVAAILHNVVFYHQTCMLNPFGHDYSLAVVAHWLANDPSLPMAVLLALMGYQLGNRFEGLQAFVVPFLIAFLPLTIWIWDIPFTDRIVCMHLHDRRMLLAEGLPLKGRHLYYFGAALYTLLTAARLYSSPFLKGGGEWTVARKKFGTPQPQEIAA